jgi:hypothetical protein
MIVIYILFGKMRKEDKNKKEKKKVRKKKTRKKKKKKNIRSFVDEFRFTIN